MRRVTGLASGFLFERAPHAACHAATIAETGEGLVAAWFGGTREGAPDVGIWLARQESGGRWSEPAEMATGAGLPCWNPVLFQPQGGPLMLFWRIGPNPRQWWSFLSTSRDGGRSWSGPRRLPKGILGPIKNKPLELDDGNLLCPSSTEHLGWRCHIERTDARAESWQRVATLNRPWRWIANQPSLVAHGDGRVQALCRTRNGVIAECWSLDGGRRWRPMRATGLPNPNSGLDALRLPDGRILLATNPVRRGRTPLALLVSADGVSWREAAVIADGPGEYSYPSLIVARDGRAHLVYSWNRLRIAHVAIDPSRLG
jgi:predicted neuraminidase